MLEIDGLSKRFMRGKPRSRREAITALEAVRFTVPTGEIFGLIGPNGAGKTTLLKILSTLILPDEGTAQVEGFDILRNPEDVKGRIGLLAGEFVRCFYWRLSARENLEFFAKLRGMWHPDERIDELLRLFSLEDHEHERVMTFSTGMKHKLALAMGLLHDPAVLFLDEPLTGIDPLTAYEIKALFRKEFSHKTVIWASHNLYEVEEMCDHIGLLNKGRIVLQGAPEDLRKGCWDHTKVVIETTTPERFKGFPDVEVGDRSVVIRTRDVRRTLMELSSLAQDPTVNIGTVQTQRPSLEDIFRKEIAHVG